MGILAVPRAADFLVLGYVMVYFVTVYIVYIRRTWNELR